MKRRQVFAAFAVWLVVWSIIGMWPAPARAATTGQIAGTIVDVYTKAPVVNATITAVSPSEKYSTVTDDHGSFEIAGVEVDTYTITVLKEGYRTYSLAGATVTQSETYRVDVKLDRQLKTIATVRARSRSATSAFQPDQTVDRVTVNAAGIEQLLGKAFDTNAKQLLSELPSVTIDKNGTALIRGGTAFEGGFEFENIDYNEPNRSLSDRFQNLGSNYLLNGVGSIEIIPGGGDATHGNTGTGLISATAKRGTNPGFLNVDLESSPGEIFGGLPSELGSQRGFEWGTATQNLRLSNYMSFTAEDFAYAYGPYGTDPTGVAADPTTQDPALSTLYASGDRRIYTTAVFNKAMQDSRDFLDNLIYKFGHGNNQSVQLFVQNQIVHQNLDYGGYGLLTAVPQTFFYQFNPLVNPSGSTINSVNGLFGNGPLGINSPTTSSTAFTDRFVTPVHGAVPGAQLTAPETIDSPFSAYKFEYDNNLDATTVLKLRYTRTDNNASESLPSQGLYIPQSGGIRRGTSFDVTKALGGSKHTLQIGGLYAFTHPFGEQDNFVDYVGAYEGNYGLVGTNTVNFGPQTHDVIADFVQPQPVVLNASGQIVSGTPGCKGTLTSTGAAPPTNGFPQESCGYLYKFFPNGPPQLPPEVEVPTANQQNYSLYAQDTFAPNTRLKVLAALRLDGYNFQIPDDPLNPPAIDGLRHQRLYEPHGGIAYKLGNHDAVRVNFGRTLAIPLPTFIGNNIDLNSFAAFNNVPSYDSVTGKAATYCGPGQPTTILNNVYYIGNQTCANYAQQLYWLIRNARYAQQSQITYPLQGSTFTNYDFSYSHEFPTGAALKITPFYRRGYNIVETSQTLLGIDPSTGTQQLSPQIQSNLGIQSATGVEFEATTPLKPTGLTGTFSATYINQIGNDPPGDYLPTSSVQLGELYHSPTLAPFQSTLALTYRTRGGLRIDPVFTFHSGYPYGAGIYQAFTVNGQPVYIPYTDALYLNAYSNVLSAGTVNPQNPGTITNPNLSATRGLEAPTAGPGSLFSHPTLNTNLTVEMTPPGGKYGVTYGVAVTNLFDNVASVPLANYTLDCQLVVTALCASSGNPSIIDKLHGSQQTVGSHTTPYIVYPNQTPLSVRIFVQVGL
jgi:hypothetical protein